MLISAGNFFKVKILWRIVQVLICTKLHEKWKTHHRKSRRTKFWQRALFLISTLVTWKMHSFSANQARVIFFFMYIINISIIVLVNITLTSTVTLTISIVIIFIIRIIIIIIGVTIIIIIWLSLLTRVTVTFGPTRLPTIDNKFVSKCDSFLITIVTSMIRKVWWSVITKYDSCLYWKLWKFVTQCDHFITKYDDYWKVPQNAPCSDKGRALSVSVVYLS